MSEKFARQDPLEMIEEMLDRCAIPPVSRLAVTDSMVEAFEGEFYRQPLNNVATPRRIRAALESALASSPPVLGEEKAGGLKFVEMARRVDADGTPYFFAEGLANCYAEQIARTNAPFIAQIDEHRTENTDLRAKIAELEAGQAADRAMLQAELDRRTELLKHIAELEARIPEACGIDAALIAVAKLRDGCDHHPEWDMAYDLADAAIRAMSPPAALASRAPVSGDAEKSKLIAAVKAWFGMQSHSNTCHLYNACCEYFKSTFSPADQDDVE